MLALLLAPPAVCLAPAAKGARFKSEVKTVRVSPPALSVSSSKASRAANVAEGALTSEISADGAAMPLVRIDPTNQTLSLHSSTVHHLAQLPGPVCALSLVGTARDGKSTWLNLYASYVRSIWQTREAITSPGFATSNGFFDGTEGGWMQSFTGVGGEPLPGTECASLVLIDSQGLQGHRPQGGLHGLHSLFSLSLLTSSTVVLNVMYQLSEDALQGLQGAVGHMRSHAAPHAFGGDAPNLVVLLRDARLRLQEHHRVGLKIDLIICLM